MQRLGKNTGGYRGERIEIQSVLEQVKVAAAIHGWHRDSLLTSTGAELVAYRRRTNSSQKSVYLSTGIHGDEPAGPLAIFKIATKEAQTFGRSRSMSGSVRALI